MRMVHPLRFALAASLVLLAGCSRDLPNAPRNGAASSVTRRTGGSAGSPEIGAASGTGKTVYVPAGSSDALAAAIASAGPGGTVVLRAGSHNESATVVVNTTCTITGEPGAEIVNGADAFPPSATIVPTLWVKAARTRITKLTFRNTTGGGLAVLLDGANQAQVSDNSFRNYQFSITIQHADQSRIVHNDIVGSNVWYSGGEVHGVIAMNGREVTVANNHVSNCLFGLWCCDLYGKCFGNHTEGCYEGIILCKVPQALALPDGSVAGSEHPATGWETFENECNGCFADGLIAIDGANHCEIENNNLHDNAAYDMEFTGDTYRFGFLTPMAHDNHFEVGRYKNVRVKNCGDNNHIEGGILVDNAVDPCF
jgi:hypothetical protein